MAPDTTTLAPGTFSWVDLATTDPEASKAFYGSLFGWTFADMPVGGGHVYSMARLDGKDVAAMKFMEAGAAPPQGAPVIPPHWASYVLVANADDAVRRIGEAGGTILAAPMDAMTAGRMAVAQDPTGAAFCLWQARDHVGAGLFNAPGSLCWNELMTTDTEAAKAFYTAVFGWEADSNEMLPGMLYTVFKNQGRPAGGMMTLPEEARQMGAPPNWLVYFAVADCDATFQAATVRGARPLMPPTDFPGVGRGAVMADPVGAAFAFIQLLPQA